jgi:hypothetical protein
MPWPTSTIRERKPRLVSDANTDYMTDDDFRAILQAELTPPCGPWGGAAMSPTNRTSIPSALHSE